jgi:hypothetical protein
MKSIRELYRWFFGVSTALALAWAILGVLYVGQIVEGGMLLDQTLLGGFHIHAHIALWAGMVGTLSWYAGVPAAFYYIRAKGDRHA